MRVRKRLGELLLESDKITHEQLETALREQKRTGGRLGQTIIHLGYLSEIELLQLLEQQLGVPLLDLSTNIPEHGAVSLIPSSLAERHQLIPVRRNGNKLVVAMTDPTNFFAIDDVRMITNMEIEPVIAAERDIRQAIDEAYSVTELVEKAVTQLKREDLAALTELETADDAPIISIVNSLISQAIKLGASDIHVEPLEKYLRVRFRVDGVLREMVQFPKHAQNALTSRIKIMSEMDIAEKRVPQDGRIKVKELGRDIDLRVSTLPTIHGEKVVMRILDSKAVLLDIGSLGYSPDNLSRYRKMYHQSYGMILVTGPTGSGKTTTLYATLTELNTPTKNIITVEDPVEYRLPGVNQVQVNPKAGLLFSSGLRSILRQDPNIILVGEIRDNETAEIAIRSALTGHLVLSTLHTNDAAGAVTRLVDMGIEPFLVASSVLGAIAQRLVRRICPDCRQPYNLEPGSPECLFAAASDGKCGPFFRGAGCPRCGNTGYRGRIAIHEVMPMSATIREMVTRRDPSGLLAKQAQLEGMRTMQQDGMAKAKAGLTTVQEIMRVAYSEV